MEDGDDETMDDDEFEDQYVPVSPELGMNTLPTASRLQIHRR
jgi:hypothetical protein